MKEINPRHIISVEFDIEEFMLLTGLMGDSNTQDYEETMKKNYNRIIDGKLGGTLYHEMNELLKRYGILNNIDKEL